MIKFSQFAKLTVICNVCFLITFINHYYGFLKDSAFTSIIILLGQLFAVFLNIIFLITYGYIVFIKKNEVAFESKILFYINIVIFIIQLYYYFIF
jgi:amino acid permease